MCELVIMMQKQQLKNSRMNNPSLTKAIQLITLLVLLVIGIAYKISASRNSAIQTDSETALKYALIGDIGGTNIRYQLVSFATNQKLPIQTIKQQRLKVIDFETFEDSISHFLSDVASNTYPDVAVIAIAGPIQSNTVIMPNIAKWGQLNGTKLAINYNISSFLLINDFQAASYGLLIVDDSQFIKLNNLNIQPSDIRGVIGPGTGLGHSIIFNNQFVEDGITVLPSEAGHSDVPFIDDQTTEYTKFLKQKLGTEIDLEKTFCGPSIPIMYEFYARKLNPNQTFEAKDSTQIVQQCIKQNPDLVYQKVFKLFIKFYSSAIANFMIQHMATGGVYLVGSLTKAFLPKIQQTDILQKWKIRHPDMRKVVENIPLIFCTEVDLGLRGAFVMAKRLSKHVNKQNKTKLVQDIF